MDDEFVKLEGQLLIYSSDDGGFLAPIKNGVRLDIAYKVGARFSIIEFSSVDELQPGECANVVANVWLHSNDELTYYKSKDKHFILSGENEVGEFIMKKVICSGKY